MSDVVVVLPGILGSALARDGRPVWGTSARVALGAVRRFTSWVEGLTLPDGIGDGAAPDGITPTGLLADLHVLPGLWTPVRGYDRLVQRLRSLGLREGASEPGAPPGDLVLFAYDWRLSIRFNARRLGRTVEPVLERWRAQGGEHAEARLVFVAHSMGGLVARRYVECEGGATLTRKIVTLGTPYRGAARALAPLVNGMPGFLGPAAEPLTRLARSLPSLHQLLPEYACIDTGTGDLSTTAEIALPGLSGPAVADARAFHDEVDAAARARSGSCEQLHLIVGARQPTATTARLDDGRVRLLETYRAGDRVEDDRGDATVPAVGALPRGLPLDTPLLHHVVDHHGNLARNTAALDEVQEAVTARPVVRRALPGVPVRVRLPELVPHGEAVVVEVMAETDERATVTVRTTTDDGRVVDARRARLHDGRARIQIEGLEPGVHTVDVGSLGDRLTPVGAATTVGPRSKG